MGGHLSVMGQACNTGTPLSFAQPLPSTEKHDARPWGGEGVQPWAPMMGGNIEKVSRVWCVGHIGPGPESQAASPRPWHGHHGNFTVKDQMTSDFAFHPPEWVLKCRQWLLDSIEAAEEQQVGPEGCAGGPQAHPTHLSELPFTSGWPHILLIHSDLILITQRQC